MLCSIRQSTTAAFPFESPFPSVIFLELFSDGEIGFLAALARRRRRRGWSIGPIVELGNGMNGGCAAVMRGDGDRAPWAVVEQGQAVSRD